jgi:nucleotide-binding universal stress UspA family protein
MAIRTILACASGGTASDGAIELGCRLARRFEAHLECFHVKPDPQELLMYAGDGFGLAFAGNWIEQFSAEAAATAAKTKAAFAAATERHGLAMTEAPPKVGASAAWRVETGYAPLVVSGRARFFDLAVLGRSDRVVDRPHSDTVEETLIRSGRPILLAPAQVPAALGNTIAFGWDGSPGAVRVLTASLPLLAAARAIFVITVGDRHEDSAGDMIEYLGRQGITATRRHVRAVSGVGREEQLLAAARDEEADLLVMGGYGHTPWREMLFGGATREVVGTSLLPLLLSH